MHHARMSPSAQALDRLLSEGGAIAAALKSSVHRTMLWRFRSGRRLPDAQTIAKLHEVSGGLVPADGWTRAEADDQVAPHPHARPT